jgi:nucleotide-binding universal stress UspA family protein
MPGELRKEVPVYKHILIPTDGSSRSNRAVRAGVALAQALGARVTGLYAAPPATPIVFGKGMPKGYMTPAEHARAIERTAQDYLAVIERAAAAAGVPCETLRVTSDFPAETILETARKRKCDLVVMSSHGQHGIAAVLLGSQTNKVLAHARLPVLVHR